MKRYRLTLLLALAVATPACLVLPPVPRSSKAQSCPPGHRWSDGQCHKTGKGHDPDHHGKGKDKD